ncbi:biogenesis of lysosome-related organelles complex 1 subunit 1 [Orobanche gracilis]
MERPHQVEAGSLDLEASLLQMINEHKHASIELQGHTEQSKKEAIRSAERVSDLLVNAVNRGVQEVFIKEKQIEMEIRALTATIIRFSKQTEQWLAASHAINNAVKEIGDFENWMKTMELDCKSITAAICNIHQS